MKAVRIEAWGATPAVVEVADPPSVAGQTVVRIEAATVGHIDRSIWQGRFAHLPQLPYTPGVEGAGTVVHSDSFGIGDRVWLRGRGLGTATDGTWAELVSAPDGAVAALPATVPFDVGAVFFSPTASAWISLHDLARVRPGEVVAVAGATGAVGRVAVQLALDMGHEVIGTISSPERASLLPDGVRAVVLDGAATPDLATDVVIDTVGGAVLTALLPAVRPGGRVILVGYVAGSEATIDLPAIIQRDITLLPLNMINREQQGRDALDEILGRLADGRVDVPVTRFAMEAPLEALDWLKRSGRSGRAVLVP